jgi:hypothetical protein
MQGARRAGPEKTTENAAKPRGPYLIAVLDFETGAKEITSYVEAIPDLPTAFLTADGIKAQEAGMQW